MTSTKEGLGGRLPLLDPTNLQASQQALYKMIDTQFVPWANQAGFKSKDDDNHFIGPFNSHLYSPEISESFIKLQQTERVHTSLSKRVREVVILTVGSVWEAPYELYAHRAVGMKVGFSLEQVEALATGKSPAGLDDDEQVAQEFTQQIVANRSANDEVYARAQKAFGERGLVDMLMLIGCYQNVCALLTTFAVPAPTESHSH